jgi:hypothetical protein
MTAYELYLVFHVAGAIVWVGSGFLMVLLGTRSALSRAREDMLSFARNSEWLGLRLYLPSNAIVLATAFLLVEKGSWGYDAFWIKVGLAGFAASFLIGAVFFGPGWARMRKLGEEGAEGFSAADRRMRQLLLMSWIDLGILLAVVFAMTLRPAEDDAAKVAVTVLIPVVATAIGYLYYLAEGRKPIRASASA